MPFKGNQHASICFKQKTYPQHDTIYKEYIYWAPNFETFLRKMAVRITLSLDILFRKLHYFSQLYTCSLCVWKYWQNVLFWVHVTSNSTIPGAGTVLINKPQQLDFNLSWHLLQQKSRIVSCYFPIFPFQKNPLKVKLPSDLWCQGEISNITFQALSLWCL